MQPEAMTQTHKTPAERILAQFGVERLSAWTGRHRSRVHAWTWPTDKGGTGGAIPPRVRKAIIDRAASEMGVQIGFADFEPKPGEQYMMEAGQ